MTTRSSVADLVADVMADGLDALDHGRAPMPVMARHVADHLGAEVHAHGGLDVVSGAVELHMWPETVDTASLVDATRRIPHTHPLLRHWMAGHTGPAAISALVGGTREWRHSEAYAILKSTIGCTETAGIRLDRSGGPLSLITCARSRDFTDEELDVLRIIDRPLAALEAHARRVLHARVDSPQEWDAAVGAAADVGLTPRELELLAFLAQGLLASTIAAHMVISVRTVHKHLGNIYAKLGTHDRLSTVIRAQALGLLPLPPLGPYAAGWPTRTACGWMRAWT